MTGIICRCKGCGKKPSELIEYVALAEEEGYSTPDEVVVNEEGTYNPKTGAFYCTSCYIKVGMPLGLA